MLMRYQLMVEGSRSKNPCNPHQTFIFRSSCWEPIARYHVSNFYQRMCKYFVDNKIEQALKYETWLFPINITGKDCSITASGDHWTLLRFTLRNCTWTFYNSMSPRKNQIDHHLNKAMELVHYIYFHAPLLTTSLKFPNFLIRILLHINYVEAKIREHLLGSGIEIPLGLTSHRSIIQQSPDSPRQGAETLDCGVVICDLLERMIKRELIPKQGWSVTTGGTYHAKMVDHFFDMCKNNAMKLFMIGV